jgi:hypothetical protein
MGLRACLFDLARSMRSACPAVHIPRVAPRARGLVIADVGHGRRLLGKFALSLPA